MAFKKGVSGNPGGRPKSFVVLSERCKEFTDEIVDRMVAISRGIAIPQHTGRYEKGPDGKDGPEIMTFIVPSFADQIRACEWLADRGHGKAATVIANPDLTPVEFTIAIDGKRGEQADT